MIEEQQSKFQSIVGPLIAHFIKEKQSCGYTYRVESDALKRFDRFLEKHALAEVELPKDIVIEWISKTPNESARTHRTRRCLIRRFAEFMVRHGYPAYIPQVSATSRESPTFVPRIFTNDEIQSLFYAADTISLNPISPLRHLIIPMLLRVLYCCGLRLSEALRLQVADVDLISNILIVKQGKYRKDRLVPVAATLSYRLQKYCHLLYQQRGTSFLFPAPHDRQYHRNTIYVAFRQLLWRCRIAHGGRGKGPRLHDLRHTFAVHRLVQWYREGANLNAKLPILATYLGHYSVSETQHYLRLTAELFPDLTKQLDSTYGYVIPVRTK